ncbi:MAG TPA: hypothetical protein PKZ76_03475 [Xanthomonadaceae bacterium]|nr:hypothetical protein [Xanthomonadaceae bacterium]
MVWLILCIAISAAIGGWVLREFAEPTLGMTDEDTLVLLAWEAGELSEGQVARALERHRVDARTARDYAVREGVRIVARRKRAVQ